MAVISFLGSVSSGGGGGGGYFGGGGGGVDDPRASIAGAGGGGSGFNDPSTNVVSKSTNTGDGSVTITYPVPATTTTSGVLLDATSGAAIPNSCVVFSPAAFPGRTNYDSVGEDGTWSFTPPSPARSTWPSTPPPTGTARTDPPHSCALLVHQPAA